MGNTFRSGIALVCCIAAVAVLCLLAGGAGSGCKSQNGIGDDEPLTGEATPQPPEWVITGCHAEYPEASFITGVGVSEESSASSAERANNAIYRELEVGLAEYLASLTLEAPPLPELADRFPLLASDDEFSAPDVTAESLRIVAETLSLADLPTLTPIDTWTDGFTFYSLAAVARDDLNRAWQAVEEAGASGWRQIAAGLTAEEDPAGLYLALLDNAVSVRDAAVAESLRLSMVVDKEEQAEELPPALARFRLWLHCLSTARLSFSGFGSNEIVRWARPGEDIPPIEFGIGLHHENTPLPFDAQVLSGTAYVDIDDAGNGAGAPVTLRVTPLAPDDRGRVVVRFAVHKADALAPPAFAQKFLPVAYLVFRLPTRYLLDIAVDVTEDIAPACREMLGVDGCTRIAGTFSAALGESLRGLFPPAAPAEDCYRIAVAGTLQVESQHESEPEDGPSEITVTIQGELVIALPDRLGGTDGDAGEVVGRVPINESAVFDVDAATDALDYQRVRAVLTSLAYDRGLERALHRMIRRLCDLD